MSKDNRQSPTVIEIQTKLFEYFSIHNTFEIERDFDDIITISLDRERDKIAIAMALELFIKNEVINCMVSKGKAYYILIRPFAASKQTLDLNGDTLQAISKTINSYCEVINDKENLVNPLNITERDIRNLVFICHKLANKETNQV